MCAPTFEPDQLNEFLGYCEKLAGLNYRRNMIVHGEWWFDVFERGSFLVLGWDRDEGGPVNDETVTPESLDLLAREFDEVSSDPAPCSPPAPRRSAAQNRGSRP
jgi:hypothetical protein